MMATAVKANGPVSKSGLIGALIDSYEVGKSQPSFDKQYVRDYLESIKWNKQPPCPELPPEIAQATTARYLEAYEMITGESL